MNKQTYQLNIAEPCSENWEEMTPNANGRHCDRCEKTVIDFTGKTDRQIITELKQSEGQVCGRLLNTQVNRDFHLDSEFVRKTKWKTFSLLLTTLLGTGIMNGQSPKIESHLTTQSMKNGNVAIPNQTPKTKTVNGFVKAANGEGIPYVQIGIEGTTNTAMTSGDGTFSIDVPILEYNMQLKVYGFGYETRYLEIAPTFRDGQIVYIQLIENVKSHDVVVRSYAVPLIEIDHLYSGGITYSTCTLTSQSLRKNIIQKIRARATQILEARRERIQTRKANRIQQTQSTNTIDIVTIEGKDKQKLALSENLQWIQAAYPNPFENQITVDLRAEKKMDAELVLFDELGRSLFSKAIVMDEGVLTTTLDLGGLDLVPGSYFLSLLEDGAVLQTQLMIKGDGR